MPRYISKIAILTSVKCLSRRFVTITSIYLLKPNIMSSRGILNSDTLVSLSYLNLVASSFFMHDRKLSLLLMAVYLISFFSMESMRLVLFCYFGNSENRLTIALSVVLDVPSMPYHQAWISSCQIDDHSRIDLELWSMFHIFPDRNLSLGFGPLVLSVDLPV